LTVGIAGGCAAYVAQLQFSFPLADLDAVFWLFAGMLLASAAPRTTAIPRPWALVPLVAALVLAAWGATDMVADRMLRRSLRAEAAGRIADARRLADRAAHLSPGRVQYLQAAARLHGRVGETASRVEDFERGLELAEDARRIMPKDLELALDRADLYLSWGEVAGDRQLIARAAARYSSVLRRDPASSRAHLRLGVAYVQSDRAADAEREWRTAASLAPRSSGPFVNLGILHEQQGRKEDARRELQRALTLDPANSQARDALQRLGP